MVNEISPPNPPRLTVETLAQNDFAQKQLAAKANVPISAKTLLRANAVVRELSDIPVDDLSPKQKRQLIEAYSQSGRFQKAHELSGDDVYLAIDEATHKTCDCPDFETTELRNGRPVAVSYSRRFKLRNIIRGGKSVPLMRCGACGHLSIK